MKTKTKLLRLAGAILCAGALSAQAAILVEPTGSAVEAFATRPAATEWSTAAVGAAVGDFTAAAALDAAVKDNTSAADIFTQVGSSSTQPPSVSNLARHNSAATGLYIQSRPNNAVGYVALMATLQNNTGAPVNFLNVTYAFGTAMGAGINIGEEIPGWRAFYSMSGEPGSWTAIPQFTTGTPGTLSATLDVNGWAPDAQMYILWADDDGSLNNSGASQEGAYTIDNFQAVPVAGREPSLVSFSGNGNGWTAVIQDGTGTLNINQSTVTATLNGGAITPIQVSKTGDNVTLSYASPTVLASNTTNDVVITFSDNNTPAKTYTITRPLVVAPYIVVPTSASVAGVDTASSGFKARMSHIAGPRTPGDVNSIINAERQLLGQIIDPNTSAAYPNQAIDPGTPDGAYDVTTVINWNETAPTDAGNFNASSAPAREDAPVPGIDPNLAQDYIVSEIMTFLELKAGIVYRMGVNSDDGFKVTVGKSPRDVFSTVLGSFNTGRGAADSTFDFMVEADGIYPFRLLWWDGTGDGSVEWFTVTPSGEKILINDRENANAVKAYSVGPTLPAYVKYISPEAGDTNALGTVILEILLEDGATAIVPGSVKLVVNNVDVTSSATITKAAGATETKITYDPAGTLPPEAPLAVHLEFTDNATPAVTRTVDYAVKVKPLVILALDDTQIWKYNRTGDNLGTAWTEYSYNDSDTAQWQEGPALIGEDSAAVEPIRTPISRLRDADGTQITTFYFRTHFTFSGNPSAVNLLLRHVVDDGVVFYLNGQEIHRFWMQQGTINFDTLAGVGFNPTDHENRWEGPFLVSRAALRNGDNVLAAEVHQNSATSSDFMFGAELFVVNDPAAGPAKVAGITPANDSINAPTNQPIAIQLEDGTTGVVQNSIKLTINGAVVTPTIEKPAGGILTLVSYLPAGGFTPERTYTGKIEFTDTAGTARSQDFTFKTAQTVELVFGIDDTKMWRYLNTGEDAGAAWREKNFDDSAWPEGAAILAAETGATVAPIRTELVRLGNFTDYFRTHFTFTGDPTKARMRIRHAVDDGAIFYLNGQEIHRFYFDAGLTDINYLTPAGQGFNPTDHENRWEGPFDIPTTALVQGDNVIAVEVHQNSSGSSDVVFGMELYNITSTPETQTPTETRFTSTTLQADGSIRIQWTGPGTLEEASTINGTWTPISNAPNPYTATTGGDMKFYRVKQ